MKEKKDRERGPRDKRDHLVQKKFKAQKVWEKMAPNSLPSKQACVVQVLDSERLVL